jgi:hypothetical protein
MPMYSVTAENRAKWLEECERKKIQLDEMRLKTVEKMWLEDLELFEKEYLVFQLNKNSSSSFVSEKIEQKKNSKATSKATSKTTSKATSKTTSKATSKATS